MRLDEARFTALKEAVIHVESRGRASAIGPDTDGDPHTLKDNAKGLMQLMDPTGREWHRRLGIAEPYNPLNPEQNVRIGCAYLKHLLEIFDSVPLALAAYNWGPTILRAKLNDERERFRGPWAEIDQWVLVKPRVPRTAKEYVRDVMAEYERRLEVAGLKPTKSFG